MKLSSKEKRKRSATKGAQSVPMGIPITCWKTTEPMSMKILSIRKFKSLVTHGHPVGTHLLCFITPVRVRHFLVYCNVFSIPTFVHEHIHVHVHVYGIVPCV